VNRLSRFQLSPGNVADPASEQVLIDNIPATDAAHNGGDLHFGNDGYLYVSVGDGSCNYLVMTECGRANDAARDQHMLLGKILRLTRDGDIPPDNPFLGPNSARCHLDGGTDPGKTCRETFAWGLRNPFRLAFDPNTSGTRFFINDVGQSSWEEIDAGQAGADYGWNVREGPCSAHAADDCGPPPAGMTNPIYAYDHGPPNNCASITGGAFVPNGLWPTSYNGAYLFSDYVCGTIFSLTPDDSGGYSARPFVTGLGASSAVTIAFGPHGAGQALYYTTFAGDPKNAQVRRISYIGGANAAPTARLSADPTFGDPPLLVSLDGSQSSDPDGDELTYQWSFGDGSDPSETSGPGVTHTYNTTGAYTATLRVRDAVGNLSEPATARIDVGNHPPAPLIEAPAADARFGVNEQITLRGSALDAEDGQLGPERLSWRVILHHNDHTHSFLQATAGVSVTISAPAPEELSATASSYLELELSATDSHGRTSLVTQTLMPRLVPLTFDSVPSGLLLEINGETITTPQQIISWEGYVLNVYAPAQTDSSGQQLVWVGWSDGGQDAHAIITPAAPAGYSAIFRAPGAAAPSQRLYLPLVEHRP
jgi:glucose/arabinose dehydrogenase/PKD repeat protein